ncbi:MAG: hypothetical protein JXB39_02925 [Deltaproteobacteria bacterium]|nr:hypothetical protein [Deltaproteobacteria bacterium]
MPSLYETLRRKVEAAPTPSRKGGARADLGLVLFDAQDALHALWVAADRCTCSDVPALDDLARAVEALRPLFGTPVEEEP